MWLYGGTGCLISILLSVTLLVCSIIITASSPIGIGSPVSTWIACFPSFKYTGFVSVAEMVSMAFTANPSIAEES